MGKEAKIKQQRKLERIYHEERKKNRHRNIFRWSFRSLLILSVLGLLSWGFIFMDMRSWHLIFKEEGTVQQAKKIGDHKYSQAPSMAIDSSRTYTGTISTSLGDIQLKLYAKDASYTVNNFVFLAREKFYDNLTFHRVIPDFMIQGGDPKGDGTGDPGYKFDDEINATSLGLTDAQIKENEAKGYKYDGSLASHKMVRGVLAMANSGPSSNGSQFFIVTADATAWLDGLHTVFGEVTLGMDVVDKISQVAKNSNDKPNEPVIIKSINVTESIELQGASETSTPLIDIQQVTIKTEE